MRHINAEIKSPQHCSDSEIAAFSCFVRKGAEVDPTGLKGRIRRAKALAFLYVNRTLVGVAALKQPNEGYRDKVFKAADAALDASSFGLELGWVFVPEEHRGKHYSRVVSAAAVGQADGHLVFSTTRSDNVQMQRTLEHLKFERAGRPYRSERGRHELVLYVTPPNKRL